MADKRLIYFTAQRVTAYAWSSGRIEAEGVFAANDEGVAEFAGYVAGNPKSLYYMLADIVEEDFVQENIPAVRGKDLDEEKANAAKQAAEDAVRNAKSEVDLARAQSELAIMAAQLAALRKYRGKK